MYITILIKFASGNFRFQVRGLSIYHHGSISVPSANCRCEAEESTADHILAFCSLYHPLNGTLGLVALDDDTVDWLKTTALNI